MEPYSELAESDPPFEERSGAALLCLLSLVLLDAAITSATSYRRNPAKVFCVREFEQLVQNCGRTV